MKAFASGFTLVESVIVIAVLGVLSVGVSSFIGSSTQIYVNVYAISEVISDSRYAMERLTRDIRNAVPNSIRIQSGTSSSPAFDRWQCLELLPIDSATRYIDIPTQSESKAEITASAPWGRWQHKDNHKVIVYPLITNKVYKIQDSGNHILHPVKNSKVNGPQLTIEFDSPVTFSSHSPQHRIYFVTEPVSYCFIGLRNSEKGELRKYLNYGFITTQPKPDSASLHNKSVLMAENVTNDLIKDLPFKMASTNLLNSAVVVINPEFKVLGETFKYQHQVQVVNVP